MDKQQGFTVQHMELYSILCNNLYEKRIWKSIYIYNWISLLYTWNLHNIVNQLHFN